MRWGRVQPTADMVAMRIQRDQLARRLASAEEDLELAMNAVQVARFAQMEAEARIEELETELAVERIGNVPVPDWWSPATSGRKLGYIDPKIMDEADSESDGAPADFDRDPNVVTSVIAWEDHGPDGERIPAEHWPVLDIDYEARLVPSSTPGHYHLYIEKSVTHDQYMKLLDALGRAGIVGPGYDHFSRGRGYTTARLPHVKKPVVVDLGVGAEDPPTSCICGLLPTNPGWQHKTDCPRWADNEPF